jgi:hypothetical protein
MPLSFSDAQLATIDAFAKPLHRLDRDPFVHAVVRLLEGQEIGVGNLNRACREAQAEFLRGAVEARIVPGKYAR